MSAQAATVLQRIVGETREELARRKLLAPSLEASPPFSSREKPRHRFRDALAAEGIGVIAEFKRRSPSAGELRRAPDLIELLGSYQRGGAVAASVLTEGPNFGGSLDDLRLARAVSELPLLRKDFIVDPYQLHEAVAAGADAVLLIVAALDQQELPMLHAHAGRLGLDVLVEVHDRDELARALEAGAKIIGVNNRDLRDFSVDVGRTEALAGEIPPGVLAVSESGIKDSAQLRRLQELGLAAVLVGETLMRSGDPERALAELTSF